MDFDVFGHTLHSVHVHCIVVDADKKKHGHTPFCSFICSDDRVRCDDSKKTNSSHNNIESYSLFFISFKKRLLFSLSLAFFFSPRSLPPSLNSHSPSRLLSFKWRNDLPSIELPAFFHCVLFLITAYIYYCIFHMHTLYMRHNIPSQWLVFVLMFCVGLLFCCFCCCCCCGCCCWLYSVVLRSLGSD